MEKLGITVFDVAVIAVAIFGALIGMSAGFAHAVLFIASWVGAGWLAWRYAKVIQPEVEKLVGSTELAYFLAMLAVFVAALIVLVMLTNALSRSVRKQQFLSHVPNQPAINSFLLNLKNQLVGHWHSAFV